MSVSVSIPRREKPHIHVTIHSARDLLLIDAANLPDTAVFHFHMDGRALLEVDTVYGKQPMGTLREFLESFPPQDSAASDETKERETGPMGITPDETISDAVCRTAESVAAMENVPMDMKRDAFRAIVQVGLCSQRDLTKNYRIGW